MPYEGTIAFAGRRAFVIGDEGSGLQVFDFSDPMTPKLTGSYDSPPGAR
jgi:hypothetical protein